MTTSRTGTTKYRRNADRVKRQARADGLTHCPGYTDTTGTHHPCGVPLDYDTPGQPNSAEVDHIEPYALTHNDDLTNLTVLCRAQNLEKGDGRRVLIPTAPATDFPLTRTW